jgi:hypothetical protein
LASCSPSFKKKKKNEAGSPKRGFGFAYFNWFTFDYKSYDCGITDDADDSHTHGNEGDNRDTHHIGMGDTHHNSMVDNRRHIGMGDNRDTHHIDVGGTHRVVDGQAYAAKIDQKRVPLLIGFLVSCFYSLLILNIHHCMLNLKIRALVYIKWAHLNQSRKKKGPPGIPDSPRGTQAPLHLLYFKRAFQ